VPPKSPSADAASNTAVMVLLMFVSLSCSDAG
jgi:hypothetical protein